MLDLRQLSYFRAVARELHFTRAAQSLHVAQPALSQQIRKLERQLGVLLFERDKHRVELTPAGCRLLVQAERLLSDATAVEEEMLGWAHGLRGRLRVGMARGLALPMAQVLADFCAEHPAVHVELQEVSTAQMIADLRLGRLDVATLAAAPAAGEGLVCRPLGDEPLVLAVGPPSALGERSELPLGELHGLDLVFYSPGSGVRDVVVAALAAHGAVPRVRFETREYRTARALVSAGLAAAVLPLSVAEEQGPAIRTVRLEPEPVWSPVLAWSSTRRPTPALEAFREAVVAGMTLERTASGQMLAGEAKGTDREIEQAVDISTACGR